MESTATAYTFAALRGEECAGVLVGAQTRRAAAVSIARAPDELVDQAAQAGLLHGPREGACYYVLTQSDTLGSFNAFALLGAKVETSAARKELPQMEYGCCRAPSSTRPTSRRACCTLRGWRFSATCACPSCVASTRRCRRA
jgi:hypothetical protein